jgi:hypothetical protein
MFEPADLRLAAALAVAPHFDAESRSGRRRIEGTWRLESDPADGPAPSQLLRPI